MRIRLALAAALTTLLAVAGACTGDGADPAADDADTAAEVAESTEPSSTAEEPDTTTDTQVPAGAGLADQYGQRYCEVLVVTTGDGGATAQVWGTQGLNDCDQAGFDAIDAEATAAEMGAVLAVPNGPRFWVLDRILAKGLAGTGELRTFGAVEMRSITTVDLEEGFGDRTPLTETSVLRDTEFIFDEGREVYELTGPDGSVYVMQSYSIEIDPEQTLDTLAGLGDRLALPDGWSFQARVLDEPLVVEDIDGIATVIQDEFRNSYQLRERG